MSSSVSSGPSVSTKPSGDGQRRHPHFGVNAALDRVAKRVPTRAPSGARVYAPERWLVRRLLQAIGNPPVHFVLWDGQAISGADGPPIARVLIRDRPTFLKLIADADFHFGDAYAAGRIDVEGDLLGLLEYVYRAESNRWRPPGRLRAAVASWLARVESNTLAGSRSHIQHHYDIGNDFYELWLDKNLVYTCAYFPSPEMTLEAAQSAKMDLICRKLWLRPAETVVEAGCGWGGLARHMARNFGVSVKAYNVSHEQVEYARARARAEGLDRQVEFIEDDYRNVAGQFDAFVSIGMLEHVGFDHYRRLGGVIDRCLKPGGRGIVHSIGRDWPGPVNRWIERRIFPGAQLPSLRQMTEVFEPWKLSILDVENLRLHYAETLKHWLVRFDAARDRVTAMFDEPFVRAWRLYLIGSIAGFTTGTLQLFQILFTRNAMNEIPWSRQRMLG